MAKFNKKELIEVAEDINEVLGFEGKDKIKTGKGSTIEYLKKEVSGIWEEMDGEQTGKLKTETINFLHKLFPSANNPHEEALETAKDLVKILQLGGDGVADPIELLEGMNYEKLHGEIVKMADFIGSEYTDENGKTIQATETKKDFQQTTLDYFERTRITPNWPESSENEKVKVVAEKIQEDSLHYDTEENKLEPRPHADYFPLKLHPYADLFPEMEENEFNEIVKDMNENGYRKDCPIILYKGKIADGKHRYKATEIAEVEPLFIEFEGTEKELFDHIIALNLKRRHLTPAQKAYLGVELLPEFEKIGKEKQKAGGKGGKTKKAYRATEEAAKAVGSTKEAVTTAKKVKKKDKKVFDDMKKGKKTIASAKRETEEKTAIEKFDSSKKVMKAKLKIIQKAIHDFFDAAEIAEIEDPNRDTNEDDIIDDLMYINETIEKILSNK